MTHQCGYNTTTKVLSVSEESPNQSIAEKLKLPPDKTVIRLERLRFEGDEPIMYCVDYVPRTAIDTDLGELTWRGSLIALLAQYQHRPRISAASVTAVMLPDEIVRRTGWTILVPPC